MRIIEEAQRLVAFVTQQAQKMNDPHGDGTGNDAVPPTGDDWNELATHVAELGAVLDDLAHVSEDEREMLRDHYGWSDDIEIDHDAITSEGEGGKWVQAWLWLANEDEE